MRAGGLARTESGVLPVASSGRVATAKRAAIAPTRHEAGMSAGERGLLFAAPRFRPAAAPGRARSLRRSTSPNFPLPFLWEREGTRAKQGEGEGSFSKDSNRCCATIYPLTFPSLRDGPS
jgi:hypothetical protein